MGKTGIALLLAASLVVAVSPALAQGTAQIRGRVLDAEGKPVKGVTLRFTQPDSDASAEVTSRKNGGFARGLPPGQYVVEAVDATRFISTLEFTMKNAQGLTLGQGTLDGHPTRGAGPFPVSPRNDVSIELVLAERESSEAQGLIRAFAAPELNEAVKLYERGKFERVVDVTSQVISETPELGEAHYMLGIAYRRLERHEEAVAALERAADLIPDQPGVSEALGEATVTLAGDLEEAGDAAAARETYARAADVLTRARERGSDDPALLIDLAQSLDRIDDDERLVPVLEQLLESDPDNVQGKLRLAGLYAEVGKHDAALAMLETLPDTERRAAVTYYNVAVQCQDDGKMDQALTAARRAAEIDPDLAQPQQLLAQLYLGLGDQQAAASAIRRFLELAPADPQADTYRRILEQIGGP